MKKKVGKVDKSKKAIPPSARQPLYVITGGVTGDKLGDLNKLIRYDLSEREKKMLAQFDQWDEWRKRYEFLLLIRIKDDYYGMIDESLKKKHSIVEYDMLIKNIDERDIQIMNLICDGVQQKNMPKEVNLSLDAIRKRYDNLKTLTRRKNIKETVNIFIWHGIIKREPLTLKKSYE